jgi:hypothetical protein
VRLAASRNAKILDFVEKSSIIARVQYSKQESREMGDLGLVPDTPEVKEPWEELKQLGISLAGILPGLHVTMPILVSGDWGSGKTSLLEVVKRQIECPGRGHSVLFEAWRHEAESHLLPAMMRAVWESLPDKVRAEPVRKQKWQAVQRATLTAAKAMGPFLAQMLGGPVLGSVFGAAVAVANQQESDGPLPAEPTGLVVSPLESLWNTLDEFIDSLAADQKPLVILIDDLDRCSPSGAVALLDSIRMLVVHADRSKSAADRGARALRFVVALDRGVLTQAVARKYQDISRFEGNRYLEKIFPLTFDLPRPDDRAIRELVDRSLDQAHIELQDACTGPLSKPIFANPRLVKRCINRLKLLRHFERGNGEVNDSEFKRLVILVEWLAATERWPSLRRLLSRRPQEYWHSVRAFLSEGKNSESLEHAVHELLDEPDLKHWLEEVLQGSVDTFYAADERLRRWGL